MSEAKKEDELTFSVGAREIYDEVRGLRSDVQHAFSRHDELVGEVDEVKSELGSLKKIVYGLVPFMGAAGYVINQVF